MQKQKRIKKDCGVYKIENLLNNKVYIGSSVNLVNRATNHRKKLTDNKHANQHLQNAYNKYGGSNFLFTVIEYCHNYIERESFWVDFYKANNASFGYNKRLVVESNKGMFGKKMPESAKEAIRQHQLLRKDEIAKWASEFHKGKIVSEESKNKMSKSQKGKLLSELTKSKISKALSKKIINIETGQIWESINECKKDLNVSRATIHNWLKNNFQPKVKIEYYCPSINELKYIQKLLGIK